MMLSAFIKKSFSAQIWKLVIDDRAGILFAEIRDSEIRQVSFTGIHLRSGNSNFENFTPGEKWLTGAEGSFDGVLFLHGYQSPQSPQHKGITALNGTNGQLLWANHVDAIHYVSVNGPVVYNTSVQPQKLFVANAGTGEHQRAFDAVIDLPTPQAVLIPEIIDHVPQGFTLNEAGRTGIAHYMEYNSFRIVSLHLPSNGLLSQVIQIIDNNGVVYNDILNEGIQKLQPESFILHHNQLIYIKNKTELKVLNL